MKRKLAITIWLSLAIIIHIFTEYSVKSTGSGEAQITEIYYMEALTIPTGYALIQVLSYISVDLEQTPIGQFVKNHDEEMPLFIWLSFTIVGYFQWFILLPRLYNLFKKWRVSRNNDLDPSQNRPRLKQ